MINHVLPRMACVCVIFVLALAHCGCQSTGSSSWASAWKAKPPTPTNPNDKEVVSYLGQKKPKKADPPNAEELQSRMGKAADGDRSRLFNEQMRLAKQNLKERRLDDAKRAYERALTVRPNDPDCHHGLAVIADDQKEFADADKHYDAAMKQRPRDANLLSDYGYSQFLRGNDQKAEKVLNEALAVSPKHQGAMANLGAIYQKQGRPDDALAMLRRAGASEGDAQQYVAQLFPQSGAGNEIALVQGTDSRDSRTAPPMPTDDRRDLRGKSPEQLKEEMNRLREEGIRKRQQQDLAAMQPPRRDWDNSEAPQNQAPQTGSQQPNQPWVLGGRPQNSNGQQQNQMPVVTPGGGYGQQNGNNPQYVSNQPLGGFTPPNGPLLAPQGTSPNIELWSGSPNQNSNQQPSSTPQGNMAMQSSSGNGWNQPPQNSASPFQSNQTGNRLQINGLQPGLGGESNVQNASGDGANMAAAQLGMNVGPGGMFPLVSGDSIAPAGFSAPNPPGSDSRFGGEWSSPPQYQNPNQNNRGSFSPPDMRQQNSPYSQNGLPLSPPSISDDWSLHNPRSDVTQARGESFQDGRLNRSTDGAIMAPSAGGTNMGFDGFQPGNNAAPSSRSSANQWGNSTNSQSGALPYSGPWPSNGSQSTQQNSGFGNSTSSNYPPPWNRGGTANSGPQTKVIGPSSTSSSVNAPEQWPYARGQ